MLTPQAQSFSTPIQARLYAEKGLSGLSTRVLDLRSPHTKFNLMRKLQEVKEELHGSSDEDTNRSPCSEDGERMYSRLFINEESAEEDD